MSEVLENGFRVKTLLGGIVKVEKFLAEGGQGGVYIADYNGQKKALKWYKKEVWVQILMLFMKISSRMSCEGFQAQSFYGHWI